MGVRILHDKEDDYCCLYCSVTMQVFGPIMYSLDEAEEFLEYLGKRDARRFTDKELEAKYYEFRQVRDKEQSPCNICGEMTKGQNNLGWYICSSHTEEEKKEAYQRLVKEGMSVTDAQGTIWGEEK